MQPLLVALLALPWLWPWAPGPSAQVLPLLASWACALLAALLWLLRPLSGPVATRVVAGSLLLAALTSSAIGLLQWFGLSADWPGVHTTGAGEAFGNLRQRNQFASLMALGWVALLCLQAMAARPRAAWQIGAVLLALGSAASLSRTGALQWVLVGLIALLRPGSRPVAATGLAAYLLGVLGLPALLQAWQGVEATSLLGRVTADVGCSSRRVLWANVLQLIGQRPGLGWGAGELDFAHYATLYSGPRFCEILDNAHNLPLHLAVEFGLPLTVGVFGAMAWIVARARPWRERAPARLLAWGALGVIGLHSLLEYPLWYGPFQLAVLLSAALLWPGVRWFGRHRAACASAAVLAGGAVAWAVGCYLQVSQAYLQPDERRSSFRTDPLRNVQPGPFTGHAAFAELMLTPLRRDTAAQVHALAGKLLHFSPEPRVITARIESAVMLGQDEDALWHLQRFRAAFPREHAQWASEKGLPR